MRRRLRVLLFLAPFLSCAVTAWADVAIAVGRVYELSERSTYQNGCFPPCLCPVLAPAGVRGIFKLTPTGFDGLFNTFVVSNVSWIAALGDSELLITGSGTYSIGGEVALEQRLELDLVINGGSAQHFDSGFVPADATQFPSLNVTVSINHMVCQDTVIVVDAVPVQSKRMLRYRLAAASTFQQGCGLDPASPGVPPCDCPPGPKLPIRGTFRLMPLSPGPLFTEFAVVDVRWRVLDAVADPHDVIRISGAGWYRVGGEFAVEQQLALALAVGGEGPILLDSGLVVGGGQFPMRIDAPIATAGSCFERKIDVHAKQGPALARLGARQVLADDIPVAHTPPGGYGDTVPAPILARCTEPLVAGAPDLRGTWGVVSAVRNGEPVPAGDPVFDHLQRIEQCGNRLVVTAGGVIHDMRCDGTAENGVNDVAASDFMTHITVAATYENGVHVLRPVGIPIEVTRHLEGDEMVWNYLNMVVRLRRTDESG